jgi:hypothetical protein
MRGSQLRMNNLHNLRLCPHVPLGRFLNTLQSWTVRPLETGDPGPERTLRAGFDSPRLHNYGHKTLVINGLLKRIRTFKQRRW